MKKIVFYCAAAVALLSACGESEDLFGVLSSDDCLDGVQFRVKPFENEGTSRVAITPTAEGVDFTWTAGDTLGVFPKNGYPTAFPISDGANTSIARFDGADWALRPNAQYVAYYPFACTNFDRSAINVSYVGQAQDGNNNTAHLGAYDYLASVYTDVDAEGNANFQLSHLGALVKISIVMPEADNYSKLTISTDAGNFMTVARYGLGNEVATVVSSETATYASLDLSNINTSAPAQTIILYMMMAPTNLSGATLTFNVTGSRNYTATANGKNMVAGAAYAYNASCEEAALQEYVDLALPSGTLWATRNVGASNPWEYGDYFAWGETEGYDSGKKTFSLASYKWCNGTNTTMTKYCSTSLWGTFDNKSVLEPADDAATVNWGSEWKMPSQEQIQELYDNTTSFWTTEGGVNGWKFIAKNGNSIFLPAAGRRSSRSLYGIGTEGNYLSSSLSPTPLSPSYYAQYLKFNSNSIDRIDDLRYHGRSIRPVRSASVSSIVLSNTRKTITVGDEETIMATVLPMTASGALNWTSSNSNIATVIGGLVTAESIGSCIITASAMDGSGITATCEIVVVEPEPHEYVDLGLPSGTLWAICNVGANEPEEFGDYFAWGETKPSYVKGHAMDNPCVYWRNGKNGYNWESYKWCNGSCQTLTKYCLNPEYGIVDNKTDLESVDDAATANWGAEWRMPTLQEYSELSQKCDWYWTSLNGINGYEVVGPSGESIFLPAAGRRDNDGIEGNNERGYYRASSIADAYYTDCANLLDFSDSGRFNDYWSGRRCQGQSVRPVRNQ